MSRRQRLNLTHNSIGTALESENSAETLTHIHTTNNMLFYSCCFSLENGFNPLPGVVGENGPWKGTVGVFKAVHELLNRIVEKGDLTGVASTSDAREQVNVMGALLWS